MATHVSLLDARKTLGKLVNRVAFGKERITLGRHGEAVAVLVSTEDAAWLKELEDKMDADAADAVLARNEGTVTLQELKEELGI